MIIVAIQVILISALIILLFSKREPEKNDARKFNRYCIEACIAWLIILLSAWSILSGHILESIILFISASFVGLNSRVIFEEIKKKIKNGKNMEEQEEYIQYDMNELKIKREFLEEKEIRLKKVKKKILQRKKRVKQKEKEIKKKKKEQEKAIRSYYGTARGPKEPYPFEYNREKAGKYYDANSAGAQ